MQKAVVSVITVVAVLVLGSGVVRADDAADVKAAEVGLNAAQNAANTAALAMYFLPGRTLYFARGALSVESPAETLARLQAQFDAGLKIDQRIENLEVRIYGDTAVTTFERVGTIKAVNEPARASHLRVSGVWVKVDGKWKLAHRHESSF